MPEIVSSTVPARFSTRWRFLFYARPVFRICEIVCNHLVRILVHPQRRMAPYFQREWARLNLQRMEIQRALGHISRSHAHVCAQCGHCCQGTRERDAFLDRLLQDPTTSLTGARRRQGEMIALVHARAGKRLLHTDASPVPRACAELTSKGCRIPNELRPMQCSAYFCGAAIRALSQQECEQGIRLIQQLLQLQIAAVKVALRTRFYRGDLR